MVNILTLTPLQAQTVADAVRERYVEVHQADARLCAKLRNLASSTELAAHDRAALRTIPALLQVLNYEYAMLERLAPEAEVKAAQNLVDRVMRDMVSPKRLGTPDEVAKTHAGQDLARTVLDALRADVVTQARAA